MEDKYCLIYNFPQHYRESIFREMDTKLGFEFYFGDYLSWAPDIKEFDVYQLKGFKKRVKNIKIFFNKFTWQRNTFSLVFKNYTHFVLYGDPAYLSNWVILVLCRLLGKKACIWTHGFNKKLSWKSKLLMYPFLKLSNRILLYGDYARNIMIKEGIKVKKMVCIYNSLDYENQVKIRNLLIKNNIYENYFKNTLPILIYIGRIQKLKRIDLIIDAMVLLRRKKVYCNLVIIGEDKENVDLEEMVLLNGLKENTWFYGPCFDESEIGELLFNADVCVSPGNVGLTAVHCFTYGTPVITHNNFVNQMPEFEIITSGITGDFFEENNVEDLSNKIENWISFNSLRRQEIRDAAYKAVDQRYTPSHQIEVLREFLGLESIYN